MEVGERRRNSLENQRSWTWPRLFQTKIHKKNWRSYDTFPNIPGLSCEIALEFGIMESEQISRTSRPTLDFPNFFAGNSEERERTYNEEEEVHLRRQVTFSVASVQTDTNLEGTVAANIEERQRVGNGENMAEAVNGNNAERATIFSVAFWSRRCCIDCKSFFYIIIGTLMVSVGVTITLVTLSEHWKGDDHGKNAAAAQLWVIGPVFFIAGFLVYVRMTIRLCQRRRRTVVSNRGDFLESDSRRSLAVLPPTYSRALNAKVPSNVVVEGECKSSSVEDKGQHDDDDDSLRLVTIKCDPLPPTYSEAVDLMVKAYAHGRGKEARDIGVQTGVGHSLNVISQSNAPQVEHHQSTPL